MMLVSELLHAHFEKMCPLIHSYRLQAVMDVATGLQKSKNLSLTAIGRELDTDIEIKHRIKKVDRLLGNENLYGELNNLYEGLSNYIFKYINQNKDIPMIVDLCYMKDNNAVKMMSAEVALKGRSLPVYREVFGSSELKNRAINFIENLSNCIPEGKEVLVIMDAGFGDDWFEAIEKKGWYWLVRARGKKFIQLTPDSAWVDARELYGLANSRAKHYEDCKITKKKPRSCRIVLKGQSSSKSSRKRPKRLPRNYNSANGNYQRTAKEPWVLVTNAPRHYTTSKIVNLYKKRMQIEESFRDVKSHRYGLSGRYIGTISVKRWGVLMLLASIVQVTIWVIGVVGHYQGLQSYFQANTVRDKKVFSYFYLGQLMVQHNKLDCVIEQYPNIPEIITKELARDW